jgi:hypothetical protein
MEQIEVKSMKLSLVAFKDGNIYNVYCPALNLCGCGYTETEAHKSFNVVLKEYLKYTTENQTLVADLESLGWKIKGNGKKITPPKMSELLQKNNDLDNIFNKYDFNKYSIPVKMQLA